MRNGLYHDGSEELRNRKFNYHLLKFQPLKNALSYAIESLKYKHEADAKTRFKIPGGRFPERCKYYCNVTAYLWTKRQLLYVPLRNYIYPWVEQVDSNEA
jgi:hypothetical protein